MKKKKLLWSALLLLVLGACDTAVQQVADNGKQTVVQFTSVVEGDAVTRTTGSSWTANDRIGVFMKQAGETLGGSTIVGEGDNVPFITKQGNGNFLSDGKVIEYPSDESAVDFIAYYPFQPILDNYIYKVDVTNQSKPEEIDLLYADNLTNRTVTSATGNLQFYHQLSQLVLNLSSSDNTDFSNLSVTISGIKTKADFNLVDGSLVVDGKSERNGHYASCRKCCRSYSITGKYCKWHKTYFDIEREDERDYFTDLYHFFKARLQTHILC